MATRDPFEYAAWCAGPSVDISPLSDFPICTNISYVQPTLALHHVDMTLPDLAPPPLCPCIWTYNTEMEDSNFSIEMAPISIGEITGFFEVRPALGLDQDCCAPEFNVSIDMKLPCMAFEPSLNVSIFTGLFTGSFYKDECDLRLNLKLSIPPVLCSVVDDESIKIGKGTEPTFDLALSKLADCTLKISGHISLPCMPFNVADDDTIKIGKGTEPTFDLALSKLADCTLKVSGHISLPCMPFGVYDDHTVSIGPGVAPVFDLHLEKLLNCTLKLSGRLSLPCMPFDVLVSNFVSIGNGVAPDFDLELKKLSGCTLKFSQHISLPCMPFDVADAQDIIIGSGYGGNFDLALSKLSGCDLKISGHISLPGESGYVLVSAEYSNKTFKVWKRAVKVYDFGAPGEVQVFVAISCDA